MEVFVELWLQPVKCQIIGFLNPEKQIKLDVVFFPLELLGTFMMFLFSLGSSEFSMVSFISFCACFVGFSFMLKTLLTFSCQNKMRVLTDQTKCGCVNFVKTKCGCVNLYMWFQVLRWHLVILKYAILNAIEMWATVF